MSWHRVGTLEDLPRQCARVVHSERGALAVFRTADDGVFAIDDRCPHRGGPLSAGIVHGQYVTCPLHAWTIDLASGCALDPDEGSVATHRVRIEDGAVYVWVEAVEQPSAP